MENDKSVNPVAQPWIRWAVTGVWAFLLLLSIVVGIGFWENSTDGLNGMTISQQSWIFIPMILVGLSFVSLGLDEIGSITFFGFPVSNIGPGPKIIPWLLFTVDRLPRDSQQRQFPGDPEEIFKGPDDEPLPDGMKRAIRVYTGMPKKESDDKNPLAIQMGLEFVFFIRMQISDPLTFQVKYGSLDKFWSQVRDTGDKLLNEKVSQMAGVAKLIENTNQLMSDLHKSLVSLAGNGGVTIIESGINAPDLTHALSAALRDIGKVRAEAGAEAGKIRQLGGANADAAAMLISKTSEALENASEAAKAAYVGERTLSNKTTILGTEGITQLVGMAQILANGVKKGSES